MTSESKLFNNTILLYLAPSFASTFFFCKIYCLTVLLVPCLFAKIACNLSTGLCRAADLVRRQSEFWSKKRKYREQVALEILEYTCMSTGYFYRTKNYSYGMQNKNISTYHRPTTVFACLDSMPHFSISQSLVTFSWYSLIKTIKKTLWKTSMLRYI